jgi:DNA-binding IclR family transcriptional regulator
VPRQRELRWRALPYLEDLYEATHENVHLAVYHDTGTLFLDKLTGHRSTPTEARPGSRLPGHCTATGKVFLALGPPGRLHRTPDGANRVIASISIAGGAHQIDVDRLAPTVCLAAKALSRELATARPAPT